MFEVIVDMFFPLVGKKKKSRLFCFGLDFFCHRLVAILGETFSPEMVEDFNNYAGSQASTYHFWVTPKVCFIFS